jgi:hypothetical protein
MQDLVVEWVIQFPSLYQQVTCTTVSLLHSQYSFQSEYLLIFPEICLFNQTLNNPDGKSLFSLGAKY